jgi:hypothetical protein
MNAVSPVMPGSEEVEKALERSAFHCCWMPSVKLDGPTGPVLSRWRLTDEEREQIAAGADIVMTQLTFDDPFRPTHLQVTMPDEYPVLLG